MSTRITQHIRSNVVLSAALLVALLVSALAFAPRADAFVYWTEANSIGRADSDGSNVDTGFIPLTEAPQSLAVDAGHIYWTYFHGEVARAELDGGNQQPLFDATQDGYMAGMAVDAAHVYWAQFYLYGGSIGRADLDGNNVEPEMVPVVFGYPQGVAVDAGHIYWTDGDTIVRADLDGKNVDQSFIGGLATKGGLAVDANHVYWADYGGGSSTIGRANLDGTNVERGFIEGTDANGIAVDANYIYWTDPDTHAIGRAELDGTGVDRDFVTGASGGYGIAVDSLGQPETTITSGPRGTTKNPSPSFAFSSDIPGSSFECRLDSAPFAPCVSPKSYEELPDGPHTFWVRATDPGGYADPSPASRKFTVDTKVKGEASAKTPQVQSGDEIVVEAKAKAKEDLDAKGTGKVKIRRRDGCLVGRESEPKPCKVGFKLQRVNKSVGSGKKKTLKLKATDAGNRRLVKLVEKGRKATAKLRIELSDEAGNKVTTKLKVKLKRAG